jgi:hypothetical protein
MTDAANSGDQPQGIDPPTQPRQEAPAFEREIRRFMHDVESLETTLPAIDRFLANYAEEARKKIDNYLDSKAIEKTDEGNKRRYKLPSDALPIHLKITKQLGMAIRANKLIANSFAVALISQYDAYLGRLIRLIYLARPELLNASERSITLSQLMEFGSIDEARERIIEKEVESVLRNSHSEQLGWIEKKIDIPLKKGLAIWSAFIELTERRNLFVHCDGVISDQYIKVCAQHGVKLEASAQIGKRLTAHRKYFKKACDVIFELGVKLGHVLWLKLLPNERNRAEQNINWLCVELISGGKYELARTLLDFTQGTLLRKESSASVRWMLIINSAQTYKWEGDEGKCKAVLNSHDWAALGYPFRLAVAVLQDDYQTALALMKKIGADGEIEKVDYREWPLFKKFRERHDFQLLFKDIFGEPFEQDATVEKPPVALDTTLSDNTPATTSQS